MAMTVTMQILGLVFVLGRLNTLRLHLQSSYCVLFFISHSCSYYNRTGGALKTPICLESLQEISMEDTVHDAPDNAPDESMADVPTLSEAAKVMVEDDITGHPASIAYHDSLKQLSEYLLLLVSVCSAKDPNRKVECRAPGPFEISIITLNISSSYTVKAGD